MSTQKQTKLTPQRKYDHQWGEKFSSNTHWQVWDFGLGYSASTSQAYQSCKSYNYSVQADQRYNKCAVLSVLGHRSIDLPYLLYVQLFRKRVIHRCSVCLRSCPHRNNTNTNMEVLHESIKFRWIKRRNHCYCGAIKLMVGHKCVFGNCDKRCMSLLLQWLRANSLRRFETVNWFFKISDFWPSLQRLIDLSSLCNCA